VVYFLAPERFSSLRSEQARYWYLEGVYHEAPNADRRHEVEL